MMSPRTSTAWPYVAVFVVGALIGGVAMVEVVPADKLTSAGAAPVAGAPGTTADGTTTTDAVAGGPAAKGQQAAADTSTAASGNRAATGPGNTAAIPPAKPGLTCSASGNGGATDHGVSATEIKLATTVVQSGIGSAFLGEMRYAMDAVVAQVNRAGGICGRRLSMTYKDDGWSATTGAQYLRAFIESGVFAIPVGASSEGLQVVIKSGDLDSARMPVVGTDGLAIEQYAREDGGAQPWVWPIATSTASSARIMADQAYKRGARHMAIVFDNNYHFGREAASAFNAEVHRLTGHDVQGYNSNNGCNGLYCGVQAGQNSYSGQAANVKQGKPDFIALFLEPETALTWMQDPNTPAANDPSIKYGYAAAQPLFTYQFESQCGAKCDQMVAWTGFKPNVEQYTRDPAVREYVDALRSVNPQADPYNQFSEGAYQGMQLLVAALKKVGPDLTRARLQAVLNTMTLKGGLTLQSSLVFTQASRYASTTMQAFTMQYKGTPGGWRAGPLARDPHAQLGAG
jgi:ABC-type branched-subunit amino acid transport system substrate-binding protein